MTSTWTPGRATTRRYSRVLLHSVFGGWQHTQSFGVQSLASMVSFMAVLTLIAYPLWYTVSTQVVFATRPLVTTSAGYAGTALEMQSLGEVCNRGEGTRSRGSWTALWGASHTLRPGIPL